MTHHEHGPAETFYAVRWIWTATPDEYAGVAERLKHLPSGVRPTVITEPRRLVVVSQTNSYTVREIMIAVGAKLERIG